MNSSPSDQENTGFFAWLFTVGAIVLAVPGIFPDYEVQIAVLTATLIAIVWYTRYTYESLQHSRKVEALKLERARESLATAMLAEIKTLEGGLRQIYERGVQGDIAWHRPVTDVVLSRLTLFSPPIARQIARFSSLVNDVQHGWEYAREENFQMGADFTRVLRIRAAFAIQEIPELVEGLVDEGGEVPPRTPDPAVREVPEIPESPFGQFDPVRGWEGEVDNQ